MIAPGGFRNAPRQRRIVVFLAAALLGFLGLVVIADGPASALSGGAVQQVAGTAAVSRIACGSPTMCVATGVEPNFVQGVIVPIVNGVAGPAQYPPGVDGLSGIACPSATFCLAVGQQLGSGTLMLVSITFGGVHQVLAAGPSNPGTVACPSATSCFVVGQPRVVDVSVAANGDLSYADAPDMPSGAVVSAIACDTPRTCVGVGEDVTNSTPNGLMVPFVDGVPGAADELPDLQLLSGVGCSGPGSCLAAGWTSVSGVIAPVTLGGVGPLSSTGDLFPDGVGCTSGGQCLVVGALGTAGAAAQATVTGSVESQVPLSYQGFATACPNTASCVAVGQLGNYPDPTVGVVQRIDLTTPAPGFSANPSSVSFGNRHVFATSPTSTVTVTNTGTAPLTFSSVAITGTNARFFKIASNTCTGSIAPGATCTTGVTFKPTQSRSYSASLVYTDNAPGSPQAVPLSGRGCALRSGTSCL